MGTEPREELKAKQLEKVIYFAANLVTWVDEERRDEDRPNLEKEMLAEREAIEKERDQRINDRFTELEAEVEALEKEGAKDADIKARQQAAEKDIVLNRETYEAEPDMHGRAEEHTSELQSLMRISYAVFCLKKKTNDILPANNGPHKPY